MFRCNNGVEFCGSDVVWLSQWDVGGEADLSQLYADGSRCRKREVESEEREDESLTGITSYSKWEYRYWYTLVLYARLNLRILLVAEHKRRMTAYQQCEEFNSIDKTWQDEAIQSITALI